MQKGRSVANASRLFSIMSFFHILPLLVTTVTCIRPNYDFIIVGAGTAGSTVARRLAENGKFTVLLVESGEAPVEGYEVPAFAQKFFSSEAAAYTFRNKSVPQTNAALINDGILNLLMGRVLGGTSTINGMVFNRGHPRDWINWANVTGDVSWDYEHMLPYMKKLENYQGDFPSDQHGKTGEITISVPKNFSPGLKDYWLAAGKELGYPVGDPNGPQTIGFSAYEYSKKHGRRISSYDGYIKPILESKRNLDVLTNTNVTEIVIMGGRAVAVRTQSKSSAPSLIFAIREVIISAGVYNSPLILQRSGIGPRDALQKANIPVLKELPVGRNLHDQPITGLHFAINTTSADIVFDEKRDLNEATWEMYENSLDGPYSSNRASTGQAFLASSVAISEGNDRWPDIQLCMAHSLKPWVSVSGMQSDSKNLAPGEGSIFMYMFLGRPKSRGYIQIDPKDKYGNAIIDPGFLTDSRDLQIFVDGMKALVKIAEETEAYGKLGTRLLPPSVPACAEFPLKSDPFWRCYITQTLQTGAHAVGSVKMGKKDDPTAVVDPELRVLGIDGLRVVDASIMPFVNNANTQAPVYAIAEKASDMILKAWTNGNTI